MRKEKEIKRQYWDAADVRERERETEGERKRAREIEMPRLGEADVKVGRLR